MNILDSMVQNAFKKSDDGNDLFYPSGVLGKGRIIPNEKEKKKIKDFLKGYYILNFILILGVVITKAYLVFILLAIISYIIY